MQRRRRHGKQGRQGEGKGAPELNPRSASARQRRRRRKRQRCLEDHAQKMDGDRRPRRAKGEEPAQPLMKTPVPFRPPSFVAASAQVSRANPVRQRRRTGRQCTVGSGSDVNRRFGGRGICAVYGTRAGEPRSRDPIHDAYPHAVHRLAAAASTGRRTAAGVELHVRQQNRRT